MRAWPTRTRGRCNRNHNHRAASAACRRARVAYAQVESMLTTWRMTVANNKSSLTMQCSATMCGRRSADAKLFTVLRYVTSHAKRGTWAADNAVCSVWVFGETFCDAIVTGQGLVEISSFIIATYCQFDNKRL